MSLNWDISKCKNWQRLMREDEYPVTEGLIHWMMVAGFRSITEKNWGKVFARLEMMSKDNFTVDEVYDRIGLSTNCNELTDAQWAKQQITTKINSRAIEVIEGRK
tara:strand:- start:695 stop:1009 length:315 start_codon:yes stop_codon:yes gene_type:complete